jgi:hypothetical protein
LSPRWRGLVDGAAVQADLHLDEVGARNSPLVPMRAEGLPCLVDHGQGGFDVFPGDGFNREKEA